MQKLKCEVALAGDVRQLVPKVVTVPELVVLQAIHGHGSVQNVEVVGMDKRPHRDELDRLHRVYGKAGEEEGKGVVARLFPGYAPQLPVRLSDIGMAEADTEEDAPTPTRKKASKKKAGKKKVSRKADDESAEGATDDTGDGDGEQQAAPGGDDNDALS